MLTSEPEVRMKLLYQTHSPFARKALVFCHEVGLAATLTVVHQETSPLQVNEEVFGENPLGKVPVLIRPGLSPIFDSDVICAYIDGLHEGRKLIPADGERRWHALAVQAVAQGLAEAGIGIRWETVRRPAELRYEALRQGYERKLERSYDWLERNLDVESAVHVGHIAAATCLSWLEFRGLPSFRDRARLTEWFEAFVRRPSMRATPLSGETRD